MKLVTYSETKSQLKTRPGLLWGKWILDLQDVPDLAKKLEVKLPKRVVKLSELPSTLDLIKSGSKSLEDLQSFSWRFFNRLDPGKATRMLKDSAEVKLGPPIPNPPVLRDFYAFEEHVKAARAKRGLNMPQEWYEFPAFYYSNPGKIYGPSDNVPLPAYTHALDYELEIACVLGKGGLEIPDSQAEACIAGYTIMNDWSARDIQQKEMKIGLGPAKAKDFATSLGPWIVTPDELQDRKVGPGKFDLKMTARIDGKELSNGNMKSIHWTFPQMISRASEAVELHPGEVFGSGTVGTGSLLELGQEVHAWLEPGNVVEMEVERLGTLTNRIIETPKS